MAAEHTVIITLDEATVNIALADKFNIIIEEEGFIGQAPVVYTNPVRTFQFPKTTYSYPELILVDALNNIYSFGESYSSGSIVLFYNGQQRGDFEEVDIVAGTFKPLFIVAVNRQLTASHT